MVSDPIELDVGLERIGRAPLKPQQKLEILRVFLLPGFYHGLVLGSSQPRILKQADVLIRKAVKQWLHLPFDTPNALLHSPSKYGGLGIVNLARAVPFWRERRFARLGAALEDVGLTEGVRDSLGRGFPSGQILPDPRGLNVLELQGVTDGQDLVRAEEVSASTAWIVRCAGRLSGGEYVRFLRMYSGALPTRIRLSRGRRHPGAALTCRAGCVDWENAAHIIQKCPLAEGIRTLRHHGLVEFLERDFVRRGFKVYKETTLVNGRIIRRPDLIVAHHGKATIIDVHIVSSRVDLDEAGNVKLLKYDRPWILRAAAVLTDVPRSNVKVLPVTLSWKGLWSRRAAGTLRKLGVSRGALEWMTIGVLRGSYRIWTVWERQTAAGAVGRREPDGQDGLIGGARRQVRLAEV